MSGVFNTGSHAKRPSVAWSLLLTRALECPTFITSGRCLKPFWRRMMLLVIMRASLMTRAGSTRNSLCHWHMTGVATCRLPASVSVPEFIPIWWACNARRSRVGLIGYIPTLAARASSSASSPTWDQTPPTTRHAPKSSRVLATSHQCARKSASTVAIPAIIEPVIAIAAGMALGNSRLITVATKIAATGRTITK